MNTTFASHAATNIFIIKALLCKHSKLLPYHDSSILLGLRLLASALVLLENVNVCVELRVCLHCARSAQNLERNTAGEQMKQAKSSKNPRNNGIIIIPRIKLIETRRSFCAALQVGRKAWKVIHEAVPKLKFTCSILFHLIRFHESPSTRLWTCPRRMSVFFTPFNMIPHWSPAWKRPNYKTKKLWSECCAGGFCKLAGKRKRWDEAQNLSSHRESLHS